MQPFSLQKKHTGTAHWVQQLQKPFILLLLCRFLNAHQVLDKDLLPLGYQQALHPWPTLKMTLASLRPSNLEQVKWGMKILLKGQNHQINISTTVSLDWDHHCHASNSVLGSPTTRETLRCWECVPGKATELVKGQENKSFEEQLWHIGLFSLEKRRFRGDLVTLSNYLKQSCGRWRLASSPG